ncbi:MAG: RagB/SusD family nutrient uptake outer membrane protein [Prevotella sp.]|jgi:hypothetical protein
MKKLIYYIVAICICSLTSCDNWLDVKPSNNEEEKELFSTESGFESALTGVYIGMKTGQLYGENLTMGMLEYMAQHWVANSADVEGHYSDYDYENAQVETSIKGVYAGLYNVILNINNLLRYADNGVLQGAKHDVIKGEALGLRAFLQFDLLRLFGPVPGTQDDRKMLAYATAVTKEPMPIQTWDEYIALLEKDLNEAETLLKDVDMNTHQDPFFSYRHNRMNYWAVQALKARFYLWTKNNAKAKEYAGKVIHGGWRSLCQNDDIAQTNDYIASKEHLFSLHVYDLKELTERFIYRPGGVYMPENYIRKELFESDITDVRLNTLWKQVAETSRTRFVLMKYKQDDRTPNYAAEQIPLIRLYEMYLIMIECSEDVAEYTPLVDKLMKARNVSLQIGVDTPEKKERFLNLEYNKEFYGEGQLFYQYKRRGAKDILWSNIEGTKSVYELPIPKTEIKYKD